MRIVASTAITGRADDSSFSDCCVGERSSKIGAAEDAPQRSSAAPPRPSVVKTERRPLEQSGEGAALSAAIQRLIAERDCHKSLAAASCDQRGAAPSERRDLGCALGDRQVIRPRPISDDRRQPRTGHAVDVDPAARHPCLPDQFKWLLIWGGLAARCRGFVPTVQHGAHSTMG